MTSLRRLSSAAVQAAVHRPFPSLILGANKSITPIGSFAEATAEFLQPDEGSVNELRSLMRRTRTGIVAHYYMDVELQGILHAANLSNKHKTMIPGIAIADSLAMGDAALDMARAGNSTIACLGVDFMSESVQAILHHNQLDVPVYRLADRKIGCSLAESAERDEYTAWLESAARASPNNALHVVYINTSLETKAHSHSIVPTITCTSSNVLQTLLTASLQIPNVQIYYGPDTYMGDNLKVLLKTIAQQWDDETIATKLHKSHNRTSIAKLHDSIHVFPSGNCVVHHMFGANVVDTVREYYADSYMTAHLEVPGEMFELANAYAMDEDRGVVGSTSNILNFIARKVETNPDQQHLSFILGTEAGMVTSIVQKLQTIIREDQTVEIVFPVASEAISIGDDASLPVVPGVAATEGCSTAGGCATCPFMKMNDFDALLRLLSRIDAKDPSLTSFRPENRLENKLIRNRPAMEWAIEPITYMRSFGQHGRLPEDLVQSVTQSS